MLTEICAYLKNYFCRAIFTGDFVITGGALDDSSVIYDANGSQVLPSAILQNNQYFRLVGSVFNDGVHKYPASDLADEEFAGALWAMAVPPAVVAADAKITEWITNNAAALASPYQSESFEGYSYSKGSSAAGGGAYSWQDQFAAELAPYRRLHL